MFVKSEFSFDYIAFILTMRNVNFKGLQESNVLNRLLS